MGPTATTDPLVSIIVPAYNTAAFIREALDSALGQRFDGPFEVVVINDGSPDTDELERVLASYRDERITYLKQENRGSSAARNAGLRAARGQYVAMLDSDDRFHPDYLASQVARLEADPTLDVVYPDAERFGGREDGRRYSAQFPVGGEVTFSRVLARDCQVYGEVTARRSTLLRVGGYDESLSSAEDYDLWLRVLHAGGRIAYNDRVLAYYRVREDSHTADGARLVRNVLRVLEKAEALPGITPADLENIRRQRAGFTEAMRLDEARAALARGDALTARELLESLVAIRTHPKLRALLLALRLAPNLTAKAYRAFRH